MSVPKLKITIPLPCHENWEAMTPAEKGRFCHACQKTVIDFTHQSDKQILEVIKNETNLCGRFDTSQLNRPLIAPAEKKKSWFPYIAATILSSLLSIWKSNAQQVQTTQTEITVNNKKSSTKNQIISGIVTDEVGAPLTNAYIQVKNKDTFRYADEKGYFEIHASTSDTLKISYLGYESIEIPIKYYDGSAIKLKAAVIVLDDLVVQGYSTTHKTAVLGGAIAIVQVIEIKNRIIPSNKPRTFQGRRQRTKGFNLFKKK